MTKEVQQQKIEKEQFYSAIDNLSRYLKVQTDHALLVMNVLNVETYFEKAQNDVKTLKELSVSLYPDSKIFQKNIAELEILLAESENSDKLYVGNDHAFRQNALNCIDRIVANLPAESTNVLSLLHTSGPMAAARSASPIVFSKALTSPAAATSPAAPPAAAEAHPEKKSILLA